MSANSFHYHILYPYISLDCILRQQVTRCLTLNRCCSYWWYYQVFLYNILNFSQVSQTANLNWNAKWSMPNVFFCLEICCNTISKVTRKTFSLFTLFSRIKRIWVRIVGLPFRSISLIYNSRELTKLTEKQLCRSVFLNKFSGLQPTTLLNRWIRQMCS